ncbi:23S rRNA (cytidine(2498)-2'-O)-methyltransferase RlmM [Aliiglaciecola litoralis]
MNTSALLLYCRAGFEADLGTEIVQKAADLGIYGYPSFSKQSGFVLFNCHQVDDAPRLVKSIPLTDLVFARQMLVCGAPIEFENLEDRIGTILAELDDAPLFGDVCVEHPDTTEGRALSKLCRKITVPLRQALRKSKQLTSKENLKKPSLHVFFSSGSNAIIGYSDPSNRSPHPLGILRLKFPSDAPSRSTLKLDEAIQLFIPQNEMSQRLAPSMQAVDLGSCPGGWTYQLVKRGLFVHAVDNGAMDAALMETGQVTYYAEDGFKFTPRKKQVTWLVCDMIEQPQRVAQLMANWLAKGWCKETIFNLKLPMKQRFESVQQAKQIVDKTLQQHQMRYQWQAKHLYHDREEVTVHIRILN